jgi:hypothetical protein
MAKQVFNRVHEPAREEVMPYLERSLASLAELPDRVRSSDLFENEISEAALTSATIFLKQLGGLVVKAGEQWHEPHLSTEDHGDVEFAWWHNGKSLLISVTDTDVHYLRAWGSNINNEMDEDVNPNPDKLIALWRWLYG